MTPERTTHPLDDLAVYALDALDDDDRSFVEAHLEDCPACRAELDQHLTTLAQLDTPEAPPPELWDRIAQQAVATPPRVPRRGAADLEAGAAEQPGPSRTSGTSGTSGPVGPSGTASPGEVGSAGGTGAGEAGGAGGAGGAGEAGEAGGPNVVPFDAGPGGRPSARGDQGPRHRARRRGRPGRPRPGGRAPWLAAVAAAAVVVVGVAVWTQRPSDTDDDLADLAAAAADDPDATIVTLSSEEGQARARVVTTGDPTGYVLLDDLPELPEGQAYQLWDVDDVGAPVSLGVIGDGSAEATAVAVPEGTRAFAVSAEPSPRGSVAPTQVVATGTA